MNIPHRQSQKDVSVVYPSICKRIKDDFVIHRVIRRDVIEFIRHGGIKKWIQMCESLQDSFEVVIMNKT